MAAKIRLMKMLQEIRGFSEIGRRHPSPKIGALYGMQLRTHLHENRHPRRKLTIPIDLLDAPDIPSPVKITHLAPNSATAPRP